MLGVCESLIGAAVGMVTTWLHHGTPQVMAGTMLGATVCGMVLVLAFSRDAWRTQAQRV